MQDCFQNTAAYRQRFVGNMTAVVRFAPGINIAAFHTGSDRNAVRKEPPQRAADGTAHGNAVDTTGNLPGGSLAADFQCALKNTVSRSPQYPLPGIAADETRDSRVGKSGTVIDYPAQIMAASSVLSFRPVEASPNPRKSSSISS